MTKIFPPSKTAGATSSRGGIPSLTMTMTRNLGGNMAGVIARAGGAGKPVKRKERAA